MATIHYRNAKILINGVHVSAKFSEFGVEYVSETLDETSFGDTVRTNKGGLLTATMTGKGYVEFGTGEVEDTLFNAVGLDSTIITVFADGITEGVTTGNGFSMYGVVNDFTIGGSIGTLLPFNFSCASRGVTA
jgi:hypothetical protein